VATTSPASKVEASDLLNKILNRLLTTKGWSKWIKERDENGNIQQLNNDADEVMKNKMTANQAIQIFSKYLPSNFNDFWDNTIGETSQAYVKG
jgi:hypothetical protein